MIKYRAIIWDIDGTLLNTHEGVAAAVRHTLTTLNHPWTEDDIDHILATPKIKGAFMTVMGMTEAEAEQATDLFRSRYKEADLFKASLYQGITDVLETIKGQNILQAIATNKREDCAVAICHHFGLDRYCHPIVGGDRYNSRTKADLIRDCLTKLSVTPDDRVVMIGDMPADKEAADLIGIDFLGVNYGFGFQGQPKYADTPGDILNQLKEK